MKKKEKTKRQTNKNKKEKKEENARVKGGEKDIDRDFFTERENETGKSTREKMSIPLLPKNKEKREIEILMKEKQREGGGGGEQGEIKIECGIFCFPSIRQFRFSPLLSCYKTSVIPFIPTFSV